jgi:putative endopeptidase
MKKAKTVDWGFDASAIDHSVRPQDDFYQYANGSWLKKTKMPADESRWGSFSMLHYQTQQQLQTIVKDVLKKKHAMPGSSEQLVRDTYLAADNMPLRNKLDAQPLAELRARVSSISSAQELLDRFAYFQTIGVTTPWGTYVDQDSKNSSAYILHMWQSGLGLPDRDYYLKDAPEQKRVRDAYKLHMQKILALAGAPRQTITEKIETIMRIETALAKSSMSKEDARDADKTYHKYARPQLKHLAPAIAWQKYCKDIGVKQATAVIVAQPDFMREVNRLIETTPLADWKVYLDWHLVSDLSSLLSEQFLKQNFAFYGKVLAGNKKMKPQWRRSLGAVNGTVGEALGEIYVQTYFPKSSKKAMDELVSDLFAVYEARIQKLSWMTSPTKRKAIQKLHLMKRKIGYPTKWKGYKGLTIKNDDFFGNSIRSHCFEYARMMKKLGKPIDQTEWYMTPQTVNAYCNHNMNEIVFPAAILQWPFFDPKADDALNYAGIGSVIGHEMTHGFDDQGSKFDGKGNMKSWWSKKDAAQFSARTRLMVAQYDEYEVADKVKVNGKLTLGENIADLGGVAIGYDAYQRRLAKTGRKNINGLTPEERFFLCYAQMERDLVRPESVKTQVLTDPHSPCAFRVNGPFANFAPFYETFKVAKKDSLYREPKKRADIW